jgi:site-specific DNA recombinase
MKCEKRTYHGRNRCPSNPGGWLRRHINRCGFLWHNRLLPSTVRSDGKPQRQCVVRRVNDDEAAMVRRIFEMRASGLGLTRIAKTLNNERIPAPRRSENGWAPSCIREMLHRELYKGIAIWNRTQSIQRRGTAIQRKRPESEWVRLESPELRIISEELWDQVQERLHAAHRDYLKGPGGKRKTRHPGEYIDSPYLLSRIARCSVCKGIRHRLPARQRPL